MQRKTKAVLNYGTKSQNLGNGVYRDAPMTKTVIGYFVSLYTTTKRFYEQNNQNAIAVFEVRNFSKKYDFSTIKSIEIDSEQYKVLDVLKTDDLSTLKIVIGK